MPKIEIAIMLEGQDGVNWPRWQAIARAVEKSGYTGLYRSDHLIAHSGPVLDALELWASLTWLASHTSRIEFGPLVSPVSFRNPVITAFAARAVDELSGGRLRLGLGAGWQEREHRAFGFELPPLKERFARFQEGIEVITRLLRSDEAVSFDGKTYRLDDALLKPGPTRQHGPPITIGGKGEKLTLPLVARYADEWNTVSIPREEVARLNGVLDDLLLKEGRQPSDVRRSLMTTVIFGRDEAELRRRLNGRDADEMRRTNRIVGTPDAVVEQLHALAAAGLQRVMLRWEDLDDTDGLRHMAEALLPRL